MMWTASNNLWQNQLNAKSRFVSFSSKYLICPRRIITDIQVTVQLKVNFRRINVAKSNLEKGTIKENNYSYSRCCLLQGRLAVILALDSCSRTLFLEKLDPFLNTGELKIITVVCIEM